jgi:hypothetical protein
MDHQQEYISTGYPDLPSRSFFDDNTDSEDESPDGPDRPDGAARLPPVFRVRRAGGAADKPDECSR